MYTQSLHIVTNFFLFCDENFKNLFLAYQLSNVQYSVINHAKNYISRIFNNWKCVPFDSLHPFYPPLTHHLMATTSPFFESINYFIIVCF